MRILVALLAAALFSFGSLAYAVPTLEVGAPAGPGDTGIYADYQAFPTPPPVESNTAITSGNTLYAAGVYGSNTYSLGGKTIGSDWGNFGTPGVFNGKGAILVASVADGTLGSGTITVNGNGAFYTSASTNFFLSDHAPAHLADFLFFDIGNFSNTGSVPDFETETGSFAGEIKKLLLAIFGYEWVHFDVMALETDSLGRTKIVTAVDVNPASHDVTWKPETEPVPEPGTMMLLGVGFLGLAVYGKRRRNAL